MGHSVLAAEWQTREDCICYPYWGGTVMPTGKYRYDELFEWEVVGYFKKYGCTYGLFRGVINPDSARKAFWD